jgi:hypothetical protein
MAIRCSQRCRPQWTAAGGVLSVFPDGSAAPADPNLVFQAGKPITVQGIIPLTGPTIDFYNNSGGTIQILADVQGYSVPSRPALHIT